MPATFLAEEAKFTNPTGVANFANMRVDGNATLSDAVFSGQVLFNGADVARNFSVAGAKFTNPTGVANFANMQVDGNANLSDAVFSGLTYFDGAAIAGNFYAIETKMSKSSFFKDISVGREATFTNTIFKERATMTQARFQSLSIQGPGLNQNGSSLVRVGDLKDPTSLAVKLRDASDPVSQFLHKEFSQNTQLLLSEYDNSTPPSESLQDALIEELNRLLQGNSLYDEERFSQVTLREETKKLIKQSQEGKDLIPPTRFLLEDAYPQEIAKSAPFSLDLSGAVVKQRLNIEGIVLEDLDAKFLIVEGPMFSKGYEI